MSDIVNQPPHYISDNGIETIDVIEAFTKDLEPFEAYCTGNIIKYICRWKHKNGLEDLKKAKWYINKMLKDGTWYVEVPKCDLDHLKRCDPYNKHLWTEVDGISDLRQCDDKLYVLLSMQETYGEHIVKLPDGSKVRVTIEEDI